VSGMANCTTVAGGLRYLALARHRPTAASMPMQSKNGRHCGDREFIRHAMGDDSMKRLATRICRWRRWVVLATASMPVFQATGGCDPLALNSFIGTQLLSTTFGVLVGAIQQTLVTSFPSADILQILLGSNRQPFFPS